MSRNNRIQWPRSNVTGRIPTSGGLPGSMAVNWADKKVYVYDGAENAQRFSQWIEDFASTKTYQIGDFVIFDGSLWRALTFVGAGTAFNPVQWELIAGSSEEGEPWATSLTSGGGLGLNTQTGDVTVTGGSGVVVDNTNPEQIIITLVEWSTFIRAPLITGVPWVYWLINSSGALVESTDLTDTQRRDWIMLGYLYAPSLPASAVYTNPLLAGNTAEQLRDQHVTVEGSYPIEGAEVMPDPLVPLLGLSVSGGRMWSPQYAGQRSIEITPAMDGLSFDRVNRFGVVEASLSPAINPNLYDPGVTGSLVSVPTGSYTIQYVFARGTLSKWYVQYGQAAYTTLEEVLTVLPLDWKTLDTNMQTPHVALMGAVVCLQGSGIEAVVPVLPGPPYVPFSGAGGGSAVNPDLSIYYEVQGTRALQGDMSCLDYELRDAILDGGEINVPTGTYDPSPRANVVLTDLYLLDGSRGLQGDMPCFNYELRDAVLDGGSI